MSKRLQRVAESIRHELGEILLKDIKDPNLKLVSISRVDISPDLRHANVYFTTLKVPAEKVKESLHKAKGMLKSELVKRIRLKYTPDLLFYEDKGIEYSLKIDKILKALEKENELDQE